MGCSNCTKLVANSWPETDSPNEIFSGKNYEELHRNAHHGMVEREFLGIFPGDFRLYTGNGKLSHRRGGYK